MKKYVYDLTKFLTRDELMDELRNINYINPKKEEILGSYNIDMDNIDMDDVETTITVNNFKKDIRSIFNLLDFSVLEYDETSESVQKKKARLLNLLSLNGIDLRLCDVYELGKAIEKLKINDEVIDELNKKYIDKELIMDALNKIDITINKRTIDDLLLLINNTTFQQATYLPIIRNKYYDELDNITYTMEVNVPEENHTNLRSFSGEIYESLNFKSDAEAKEYETTHQMNESLDSEIKTYIHFKGEEVNDTWHKEMHIIKQKNSTVVKYGDNYTFLNENNNSITGNEINAIMEFLKHKTPNNEFLKYVLKELKSLKKVLGQRSYVRKNDSIDKYSLQKISQIVSDENYGEDRNIYFKSKIVSSTPLKFNKENIKTLKK